MHACGCEHVKGWVSALTVIYSSYRWEEICVSAVAVNVCARLLTQLGNSWRGPWQLFLERGVNINTSLIPHSLHSFTHSAHSTTSLSLTHLLTQSVTSYSLHPLTEVTEALNESYGDGPEAEEKHEKGEENSMAHGKCPTTCPQVVPFDGSGVLCFVRQVT